MEENGVFILHSPADSVKNEALTLLVLYVPQVPPDRLFTLVEIVVKALQKFPRCVKLVAVD